MRDPFHQRNDASVILFTFRISTVFNGNSLKPLLSMVSETSDCGLCGSSNHCTTSRSAFPGPCDTKTLISPRFRSYLPRFVGTLLMLGASDRYRYRNGKHPIFLTLAFPPVQQMLLAL